ncbi:MAG: hypothetical protein HY590_00235 [Candidatus Omnitrophica bacterium]|nr:hypothetical protein [Candidatus Omnitrophota bacterium]
MELKTSARDFLQSLFYRKNVILTLFVTVALSAIVATLLATPVFEASTTLVIEKEPIPPSTMQSAQQIAVPTILSTSQEAAEMAKTQSEIIKSRVVLRKALEQLKMTGMQERMLEEKIAQLQQSISVGVAKETTDLIYIRVQDANPQTAADLANAVAQAYVHWYVERKKGRASGVLTHLDKQLGSLGKELTEAENELLALKEEGGLVSVEEQVRTALARLSEFEAEQRKALSEEEETETKLNKIRAELSNPDATVLATAQTPSSPQVEALRRKILDLELDLATLEGTYTETSTPVVKLKKEIEGAREKLNQELLKETALEFSGNNPVYQSLVKEMVTLEANLEAVKVRKQHVEKNLEEYRAQVADLAEKEKEHNRLMRQIQAKENIYTLLQNRREEAAAAESLKEEGISTVKVLDPAVPPQNPIRPNKTLNITLGCVVGLVTGIGTASLFEYFDHSFKNVDDVERFLGLPVLGSIPKGPSGKIGKKKR